MFNKFISDMKIIYIYIYICFVGYYKYLLVIIKKCVYFEKCLLEIYCVYLFDDNFYVLDKLFC